MIAVGLEISTLPEGELLLAYASSHGYEFAVSPIMKIRSQILTSVMQKRLAKDDLLLQDKPENSQSLVGGIATWVDLDSSDTQIRLNSEILVKQQISWASHLCLRAVAFTAINSQITNFSRVVAAAFATLMYSDILIRVPATSEGWRCWNKVRMLCHHNSRLYVALEIPEELPNDSVLSQWIAEPVKQALITAGTFLHNSNGFPVLSKRHQFFMQKLMIVKCYFI